MLILGLTLVGLVSLSMERDTGHAGSFIPVEVGIAQVEVHQSKAAREGKSRYSIADQVCTVFYTTSVCYFQDLGSDRTGDVILLPKEGAESGRKKSTSTSLNHLLNFTVASTARKYSGRGGMPPITRHRKRSTSHCYNKEEFLQAK